MDGVRLVGMDDLERRLEVVLGADSLLLERLSRAFRERDDRLAGIAMDSLAAYPQAIREAVEQAIMAWLFGDDAVPQAEPIRH